MKAMTNATGWPGHLKLTGSKLLLSWVHMLASKLQPYRQLTASCTLAAAAVNLAAASSKR